MSTHSLPTRPTAHTNRPRLTCRRSLTVLAAVSTIALTAAACGSSGDDNTANGGPSSGANNQNAKFDQSIADQLPAAIKSADEIKNIVFNNSPPATFQKDGKEVGWAMDLSAAIADVLGVKMNTTVSGDFSTFIPGIQNGRFDGSFGPLIVTPERLKQIDIVGVFQVGTGFASKSGSDVNVNTATDVCGLTVAAVEGSAFIKSVESINPKCEEAAKPDPIVQSFPNNAAAQLAVSNGRVKVFASNADALQYLISQTGDKFEREPLDYQPIIEGIGLNKDAGLAKAVKAAVDKLIADGTYGEILKKWNLSENAVTEAVINPSTS
ncbi:transporter substrate-binding domain-containing protein [Phycicoccus sp. Soil803]|uniref:transporter substrate-binding domain-containing protein n=1 Tax=Phycicoccus sp. Soil803 TaxID=1736415 RepID=UPI0009EBC7C5|nr:transporter substrate-binding domain-containing protein [Phycicoccus sp. Soil803]